MKEQPGLSLQLPCSDLPNPFQLELFSLTRKMDINPQIFHGLTLTVSQEPGSALGGKAGTDICCCLCVQLVLHPHSCDYRMQPKRLLGSQVLSGSSPGHWDRAGRERFAQPRIPSWECPEAPLRTQRIPLERSTWHLWDLATTSTKQLLNGVLPIFL